MIRFSILLPLSVVTQFAFGQSLSKKSIDEWIEKCDPKIEIRDISAYIIDGRYFYYLDSVKMDSTLTEWNNKKLLSLDFLLINPKSFENPQAIAAIISSKGHQSFKRKKKLLKEAILKYKQPKYFDYIQNDSTYPALLIDDKKIPLNQCYVELLKINTRQIYAISVVNHAPLIYYGQNAKNGLIQIFTYDHEK